MTPPSRLRRGDVDSIVEKILAGIPLNIDKLTEWERFEHYCKLQGRATAIIKALNRQMIKEGIANTNFPDEHHKKKHGKEAKAALLNDLGLQVGYIRNPNAKVIPAWVKNIPRYDQMASRSERIIYNIVKLPGRRAERHNDRPRFWKTMRDLAPEEGDYIAYILDGGEIIEDNLAGAYLYRGWKWPDMPPYVKRVVKPFVKNDATLCHCECGKKVGTAPGYNSSLYATPECGQKYRQAQYRERQADKEVVTKA